MQPSRSRSPSATTATASTTTATSTSTLPHPLQDMKRTWERRYFVLYNDGKLKYYDSRAKGEEKGSLDMRFFAIQARATPHHVTPHSPHI